MASHKYFTLTGKRGPGSRSDMSRVISYPTASSARRSRAASPPPATPAPLTFTDSYGRPRPAETSLPPQPSNLELFVCQRVSAELQPLLDGWRDAVRLELHAVREASADAAEWREARAFAIRTMEPLPSPA